MNRADMFMDIGASADFLARLSTARRDLFVRVIWGRLEGGYCSDEEGSGKAVISQGIRGVEPTAADWLAFCTLVTELPQKR